MDKPNQQPPPSQADVEISIWIIKSATLLLALLMIILSIYYLKIPIKIFEAFGMKIVFEDSPSQKASKEKDTVVGVETGNPDRLLPIVEMKKTAKPPDIARKQLREIQTMDLEGRWKTTNDVDYHLAKVGSTLHIKETGSFFLIPVETMQCSGGIKTDRIIAWCQTINETFGYLEIVPKNGMLSAVYVDAFTGGKSEFTLERP